MPIKKTKVSRTAPKKGGGFHFRWWMAVILVAVITGAGVAYLRFSQASGSAYTGWAYDCRYHSGWLICRNRTPVGTVNPPAGVITANSGYRYYCPVIRPQQEGWCSLERYKPGR